MKQIITSKVNSELRCDNDPSFILEYKDIEVDKPKYEGKEDFLYPNDCRLSNLTYAADVYVYASVLH